MPSKFIRSFLLISTFFLVGKNASALGQSGSENLMIALVGAVFFLALPLICFFIFLILRIVTNKTIYGVGIYAGLGLPAVFFGLLHLESDGRDGVHLRIMMGFILMLLTYLAIEIMIKRGKRD